MKRLTGMLVKTLQLLTIQATSISLLFSLYNMAKDSGYGPTLPLLALHKNHSEHVESYMT